MKDQKLTRIVVTEDVMCDYCEKVIPAGSVVFAKYGFDDEGKKLYHYHWCSSACLNDYEAEDFMDDLASGCHETSKDYEKYFGLQDDKEE